MADDGTRYPLENLGDVLIVNDRIYNHKTLRINFTTYDMRRDYDIINPSKHANVLAVSPLFDPTLNHTEDGHPFVYARVLGIYHAEVIYSSTNTPVSRTMEFLFVQWYKRDITYKAGFLHRRLHRLSLCASNVEDSFGFLDPDDVIRGCHLIPAFAHGKLTEPESPASGASQGEQPEDVLHWKYHYVNLYVYISLFYGSKFADSTSSFVDRDMYMRYRGGGIGHFPTRVVEPDPEPDSVPMEDVDETSESTQDPTAQNGTETDKDNAEDEGEDGEEQEEEESNELAISDEEEDDNVDGDDDEPLDIEEDTARVRADLREDLGYAEL